jgi:phosphinothricin acetyltransferase
LYLPAESSHVGIHEHFGFKKNAHFNKVGYKLGKWWDIGWWELFLLDKDNGPPEPLPTVNWIKKTSKEFCLKP